MIDYDISTDIHKVKFAREAAQVQRANTLPHCGEYTNGHHIFNMLVMLRILCKLPSFRLIWAIVEHDIPERLTGDIPAPSKCAGIVNRVELSEFEQCLNSNLFGFSAESKLTPYEITWLKGLDILELYLWGKDQLMLGNRNMEVLIRRIQNYIEGNTSLFA